MKFQGQVYFAELKTLKRPLIQSTGGMKMKKMVWFACVVLALGSFSAAAAEVLNVPKWAEGFKEVAEKGSPKDVDWEEVANLGSNGNVRVFFDSKKNPEIYIIGESSIPTTMNAVRAKEFARKEAEINAKAAFAKWLQEHFAVKEENERKTLVVIKGGQGGQSEGSEDRTLDKRLVTQFANAHWRGMRIMKVILKNNTCTSVWRWSLTEHTFAKMIEILTRDGSTDSLDRKHDQKIKEGSWSRF